MHDHGSRPCVTLFDGTTNVTIYQDREEYERNESGLEWLSYGLLEAVCMMFKEHSADWLVGVAISVVEAYIDNECPTGTHAENLKKLISAMRDYEQNSRG